MNSPQLKFCPFCGAQLLKIGVKFCSDCGQALTLNSKSYDEVPPPKSLPLRRGASGARGYPSGFLVSLRVSTPMVLAFAAILISSVNSVRFIRLAV